MPEFSLTKLELHAKRFAADRRGMTSIETAVMFGVFAVGFAILATSILDDPDPRIASNDAFYDAQIDNVVTGSISKPARYTIRKSVLQPTNTSKCIIFADGRQYGDC